MMLRKIFFTKWIHTRMKAVSFVHKSSILVRIRQTDERINERITSKNRGGKVQLKEQELVDI